MLRHAHALRGALATVAYVTMLSAVSSPTFASDPSTWKSLDVVIKDAEKDMLHLAYFSQRCAALMFSLSTAFSNREDSKALSKKLSNQGTSLLVISARINLKKSRKDLSNENIGSWMELQSATTVKMSNSYIDRMERNYISSGNHFGDDPFMKKEISTCSEFAKQFEN
jgi:hypothetical protein